MGDKYDQALEKFNREASKLGKTRAVILAGIVGTVAGLLGGPVGAALGGLGTAAASLVAEYVYRRMYERRHANWAFLFHQWKQKEIP